MEQPLVSVIIPTYKRPDTLKRAIDSVVNQTYKNIEIIVVDDNNPTTKWRTDTENLMEEYRANSRIIYIKHLSNKNGSVARNTGYKASKGKFIMFLDDDDEFFPEKVEAQVNCLMQRDESWGACYTRYIRVSPNGKIVAECGENREGKLYVEELKRNLFIHAGSNLMIRKEAFNSINGFDESFRRNQDVEMVTRLLQKYALAYVDVMGLKVHIHNEISSSDNMETATEKFIESFTSVIKELDQNQQKEISMFHGLQLFRYRITHKGKRHIAIQMLLSGQLPILVTVKFCVYCIKRKINRKAYGFKV